jgi:hypothetical protein
MVGPVSVATIANSCSERLHYNTLLFSSLPIKYYAYQGSNFIAAIAVEGAQNAVDHCGNDGNFLLYSAIFILFTVHYYFDT